MIHFFPKFASDVADMPLGQALRRIAVPHRIFATEINRFYKTRAGLFLRIYPVLIWTTLRSAWRSLVLSNPAPDAVVVNSDVEALIFGILARLRHRRTIVVFETFIITPRRSTLARTAHRLYYRLVLSVVELAICHSTAEARDYAKMFAGVRTRFVSLKYGMSVAGRDELLAKSAEQASATNVVVAAGRSGRDYKTLAAAVRGLPCTLRIICDWAQPTEQVEQSDQVTILRDCFGKAYLSELATADCVVVPLSVNAISAGQMVLLQAFALGKPVVITETDTTPEYARAEDDVLFAEWVASRICGDRSRGCWPIGHCAIGSASLQRAGSTTRSAQRLTSPSSCRPSP